MAISKRSLVIAFAGALGAAVVAIVLVLALSSGIEGKASPAGPTTFTAGGRLTITSGCYSTYGGYSDLDPGAQVEITSRDGTVLAVGVLEQGSDSCTRTFTIPGVPVGKGMYGASTGNGNRGTIWIPEDEARSSGWALVIGE